MSYVCEGCANPITPTEKAIHNFKNKDGYLLCDVCKKNGEIGL